MRKGVHPQWLRRCGLNDSRVGFCRKVHYEDGGKSGDWLYLELDVFDVLADDWEVKE